MCMIWYWVKSEEHCCYGHLAGTVQIVLAIMETQNLGNTKLEFYCISLLHVLRHFEDVHIKNYISTFHNVRFHELLLLFHFPDNFWSGWYFTSWSPPSCIQCVQCWTLSRSGLQYWKMHWHLIYVKLLLSITALWLIHLCSF